MCLIIHKINPQDEVVAIPPALLKDAFTRNDDGWGIMFAENGELNIVKGTTLDSLLEVCDANKHVKELFVHLRMATHGGVSPENTHPFRLGNSALMHNGIISTLTSKSTASKSDTAVFVDIIAPLVEQNPDIVFTEGFKSTVNSLVSTDRVVILSEDGRHVKLGLGNWTSYTHEGIEDGIIFVSNTYAWSAWRYHPNNHYDYGDHDWDWRNGSFKATYENFHNASESTSTSTSAPTGSTLVPYIPPATSSVPSTSHDNSSYARLEESLQEEDIPVNLQDFEIEEYSLTDLLSMTYQQLEEVAFRDPYLVIDALFGANLSMY